MRGTRKPVAVTLATVLMVSMIGMAVVFGAGSAYGAHPGDAQDVSDNSNFTVNFPNAEDHYPGQEEEGSIEYFAAGEESFNEMGAEDGIFYDWIITHAEYDGEDWIDFSACDTENTKAFGIDRGNNNSGTNYDEDLVQYRKDSTFRDDGIVIDFYDWEDLAQDPPYMAPEDAIVAAQGEGSAGGPCLTLTDQPGWYRIVSFANGTVADNGPDQEPSEDAEDVRFQLQSNFLYVCECDSEEEAREELGPPPNEDGGGDDGGADDGSGDGSEATETEGDGGGADDGGEATETEGGDDGAAGDGEATETEGGDDGGAEDGEATETEGDDGGAEDGGDTGDEPVVEDDGEDTPGSDDQPGFGAIAALVALLASALLLYRRD